MNITNNDIKVLGRIVAITTGVGNGDNGIVADASQLYDTVQKDNQENINKRLFGSIDSLIGQIEGELADYYTKSLTYNRTEIDNMIAGMAIPEHLHVKSLNIDDEGDETVCTFIANNKNGVSIESEGLIVVTSNYGDDPGLFIDTTTNLQQDVTIDGSLTVNGDSIVFNSNSFITGDLEATNATIHDLLICDLGIASSKSGNVYRFTVDQDGNVKAPNIKVESISNNHNNPNVPIFVNNPIALKSDLQFLVAPDEFRTIYYNSSTGEVDFNLGAVHMDNNLTVDGDLAVEGDFTAPSFSGDVNASNAEVDNLHVTSSAVIDGPTTFQGVDGGVATINIIDEQANSGITSSYHFSQNSGQLNVLGLSLNENISFNNVNLDFTNANTEFEHVASNTSEFAYIEATEELVIPSSAPDTPTVGDIYLDNTNNELRIRTSNGLYKVTLTPVL